MAVADNLVVTKKSSKSFSESSLYDGEDYCIVWKKLTSLGLTRKALRDLTRRPCADVQTLKWPKVPEDSSDFDETWTELIVMT